MFRTEFCPELITAALIEINGNHSGMRKRRHRLVGRGKIEHSREPRNKAEPLRLSFARLSNDQHPVAAENRAD
jgi:hypothetical protein